MTEDGGDESGAWVLVRLGAAGEGDADLCRVTVTAAAGLTSEAVIAVLAAAIPVVHRQATAGNDAATTPGPARP